MANKKVVPPVFSNDVSYKFGKVVFILTVTDLQKDTGLQALIAKLVNAFQNEICSANHWTGFYMITASVMKELIFQILEGANSNENQR